MKVLLEKILKADELICKSKCELAQYIYTNVIYGKGGFMWEVILTLVKLPTKGAKFSP